MVKVDKLAETPIERPWFKIGAATEMQEYAIRAYANLEGFKTLRGYWKHMESEGWDYYDVIKMSY